jgi:hypothetical protein
LQLRGTGALIQRNRGEGAGCVDFLVVPDGLRMRADPRALCGVGN